MKYIYLITYLHDGEYGRKTVEAGSQKEAKEVFKSWFGRAYPQQFASLLFEFMNIEDLGVLANSEYL